MSTAASKSARRVRRMLVSLASVVAVLLLSVHAGRATDDPGRFDYFVLSLSWSPTYCAETERPRDAPQCRARRPYAFVLHGLWPQYENGWPSDCAGDTWVPEDVIAAMLDVMPARGLVIHQYRKHGVCSGLAPDDYFALARRAFASVTIPERYAAPSEPIVTSPQKIEADFIAANPSLDERSVAIACGRGRRLREVRICLTRDLRPRPCGQRVDRSAACRRHVVLPPVR